MEEKVTTTISTAIYESLLEDSFMLSCLERAGVRNWDGWEVAMEMFNEEECE